MKIVSEVWSEGWFRAAVAWVLIVLVGVVVYSNTFYNEWVFDDYLILGNAGQEVYEIDDMGEFFARYWWGKQRMVGFFSFALNWAVHEDDVFGYHVVNLGIHLVNAILVWYVVGLLVKKIHDGDKKLGKQREWWALLVALVFVTHPAATQAVTYVVQRFASLATMFYLLSVIAYLKARISGNKWWWVAVAVLGIVGINTKEIVASLPVMVLMLEALVFGRLRAKLDWKVVGMVVAVLVPAAAILLINSHYAFYVKESAMGERISPAVYATTQPRVVVTYLERMVWPTNLNPDYYFPVTTTVGDVRMWMGVVGILAWLGLAAGAYRKGAKLVGVGMVWVMIGFSVESSVIPLEDVIAEQRMYLPLVGFCIALVSGWFYLVESKGAQKIWNWLLVVLGLKPSGGKRRELVGIVTGLVFAGLVSTYGILTYERNGVWRNELTLWEDTVKKSGQKARVRLNLGTAYQSRGRLVEAKREYRKAIELGPPEASVYNNLAVLAAQEKEFEKAIEYFERALELDPNIPSIGRNMEKLERGLEELELERE